MRKILPVFVSFFFLLNFFFVTPTTSYAQGTCTCEIGIPTGPGLCPWKLGVNNCISGFLPICPELAVCTPPPPCICESVGSLGCGQENEECCPGDVCEAPTQCIGVGYGYTRCLRPCTSDGDCNVGAEICSGFGGCIANPYPPSGGQALCADGVSIDTAIGCIPVENANAFIGFLLRWGIGIGGGIAFILIIVAGFQITTSSGDPKKLQAGRELLTSAIAGLVLIIFSVLILRLIGVNLLGIPGFGS